MLMHGNKDTDVSFDTRIEEDMILCGSKCIHNQLAEINVPHYLYEEDEADHIVALKPLQYNFDEIDTFLKKFVYNKIDSIVYQVWKDKIPGSMEKMRDIVPLYFSGWDSDDGEYETSKKKLETKTIIIIAVSCCALIIVAVIITVIIICKKKKNETKNVYKGILTEIESS